MTDDSLTTRHEDSALRTPADWKRYQAPDQPRGVTIVAIPLIGTMWYFRGARYWQARILLGLLLLFVSACYLALYALILWDDHRRNGYSPAFWITASVIAVLTVLGVLDPMMSRNKPLTRIRRIGNPLLRGTAGILRVLTVLVLRFLTPGLYLAALFETARPRPANEQAARADLAAQLAALKHPSSHPNS